jgi:hypothetical protein
MDDIGKAGAVDHAPPKVGLGDHGAIEDGAGEHGPVEPGAGEIAVLELGVVQVGAGQDGAVEVGIVQDGVFEPRLFEACPHQPSPGEIGVPQVRALQVGSMQVEMLLRCGAGGDRWVGTPREHDEDILDNRLDRGNRFRALGDLHARVRVVVAHEGGQHMHHWPVVAIGIFLGHALKGVDAPELRFVLSGAELLHREGEAFGGPALARKPEILVGGLARVDQLEPGEDQAGQHSEATEELDQGGTGIVFDRELLALADPAATLGGRLPFRHQPDDGDNGEEDGGQQEALGGGGPTAGERERDGGDPGRHRQ